MVEIIKDAQELHRNVSKYLDRTHPVMASEYDSFRKRIVKVLRAIEGYRKESNSEVYQKKMHRMQQDAIVGMAEGNLRLDKLIRKQQITPEMASSLFNDYDYLNAIIQRMIAVAEWLYGGVDPGPERNGATDAS
jgi:phosphate:Na+ symporter